MEGECRELLNDYFEMLDQELSGRKFVKAEYNRGLQGRIDRSKGSIEMKHMNVSSILNDLGLPYINGYKPYCNTQQLLKDLVAEYLRRRE